MSMELTRPASGSTLPRAHLLFGTVVMSRRGFGSQNKIAPIGAFPSVSVNIPRLPIDFGSTSERAAAEARLRESRFRSNLLQKTQELLTSDPQSMVPFF